MPGHYAESIHGRPDRALRVECTFNRRTKAIRFESCGNCSFTKLRKKAEQAFPELKAAQSYYISFKDDDGETSDIMSDHDLTDAIHYFQAGLDDAPVSSGASILSGFSGGSFARQYIIIQVHIAVDYDGRLSDTSSLAPSDEFGEPRRRSLDAFSLGGSLDLPELDDDQVTISSRDPTHLSQPKVTRTHAHGALSLADSEGDDRSYLARDEQHALQERQYQQQLQAQQLAKNRESIYTDASSRPPSGVFERLRYKESKEQLEQLDRNGAAMNPRGFDWLLDQKRLAQEILLGKKPTPSELDRGSIRLSMDSVPFTADGDLALQRNPSGKFYYAYSVSSHGQAPDRRTRDSMASSSALSRAPSGPHRPQSAPMHLPPIPEPAHESHSDRAPSSRTRLQELHADIPPELLYDDPTYTLAAAPPAAAFSKCSSCETVLDTIRYVCATCGSKADGACAKDGAPCKGKRRDSDASGSDGGAGTSPGLHAPPNWGSGGSSAGRSNQTLTPHALDDGSRLRLQTSVPSPTLLSPGPGQSPVTTLYSPASVHSHGSSDPTADPEGFELCGGCIESVGVLHALHAGGTPGAGVPSPADPHRSFSEWKRTAPRTKGQLRHAYLEQLLGPDGWQTISHEDEGKTTRCSTCNNATLRKRYKCLSCDRFDLCKSCYSQVHEIHPSHVFLEVRSAKDQAKSEAESNGHINEPVHPAAEPSLSHGVKCAHCMLEIVGARFHCAICENIDICFNCESAGLPGDLDSADGGHSSKHIMIKIPVPLESNKVESLSRQTVHLWTGRDAPHLGDDQPRSHTHTHERNGSVHSHNRTVMASTAPPPSLTRAVVDGETKNHQMICDNCEELIVGVRYQCASCPSAPTAYNLCASCEPRSYIVHNPMHIFFKLPRPVHRALQSAMPFLPPLYRKPAGPAFGNADPANPAHYLRSLLHLGVACDTCIERIRGLWYWCVYCAKDLDEAHEALDTHDPTHVFVVFKSEVDMTAFRRFAQTESSPGQPQVVPYPVYLV